MPVRWRWDLNSDNLFSKFMLFTICPFFKISEYFKTLDIYCLKFCLLLLSTVHKNTHCTLSTTKYTHRYFSFTGVWSKWLLTFSLVLLWLLERLDIFHLILTICISSVNCLCLVLLLFLTCYFFFYPTHRVLATLTLVMFI